MLVESCVFRATWSLLLTLKKWLAMTQNTDSGHDQPFFKGQKETPGSLGLVEGWFRGSFRAQGVPSGFGGERAGGRDRRASAGSRVLRKGGGGDTVGGGGGRDWEPGARDHIYTYIYICIYIYFYIYAGEQKAIDTYIYIYTNMYRHSS